MVDAYDVNILGGWVHTIKKYTEALLAGRKHIDLEVNAYKIKYMVMSRDQNAGESHSIKSDNNSVVRVEEFKYLGRALTN
jgi:hypothetical protein